MIFAAVGALVIGVSLGLLGSGGSILTVPMLVYVVGQGEKVAIAGSLVVVGAVAAIGAARAVARRQVDWASVLWFGLPGMAGTVGGSRLGALVSGSVQMSTFVLVMAAAGALMLRPQPAVPADRGVRAPWRIVGDGLVVGALTGFVGVGGGFLIVPALVLLGGLPMQRAVGSSLVVIAMQSLTGFAAHLHELDAQNLSLDWHVVALFVGCGAVGSLAGGVLGGRLDQRLLRIVFAWVLVAMAVAIGAVTVHSFGRSAPSAPEVPAASDH